jgi:hypothetical protein
VVSARASSCPCPCPAPTIGAGATVAAHPRQGADGRPASERPPPLDAAPGHRARLPRTHPRPKARRDVGVSSLRRLPPARAFAPWWAAPVVRRWWEWGVWGWAFGWSSAWGAFWAFWARAAARRAAARRRAAACAALAAWVRAARAGSPAPFVG